MVSCHDIRLEERSYHADTAFLMSQHGADEDKHVASVCMLLKGVPHFYVTLLFMPSLADTKIYGRMFDGKCNAGQGGTTVCG